MYPVHVQDWTLNVKRGSMNGTWAGGSRREPTGTDSGDHLHICPQKQAITPPASTRIHLHSFPVTSPSSLLTLYHLTSVNQNARSSSASHQRQRRGRWQDYLVDWAGSHDPGWNLAW